MGSVLCFHHGSEKVQYFIHRRGLMRGPSFLYIYRFIFSATNSASSFIMSHVQPHPSGKKMVLLPCDPTSQWECYALVLVTSAVLIREKERKREGSAFSIIFVSHHAHSPRDAHGLVASGHARPKPWWRRYLKRLPAFFLFRRLW